MTAGVLLAARQIATSRGLPWSSVDEIIAATNADRASAHEFADALIARLAAFTPPPSPPRGEPAPAPAPAPDATRDSQLVAIARAGIRFVVRHPHCARNSDRYRRFVLELRKRYADVTTSEFADAIMLPIGTLEDWMRGPRLATAASASSNRFELRVAERDAKQA
jgi:hypothetical protein